MGKGSWLTPKSMAYLSGWVQVRMKDEEDSEPMERKNGNENSLQIALKGKDTVTSKMNMGDMRIFSTTDPKWTLGRCWHPIIF